jgi:hypothetical protein
MKNSIKVALVAAALAAANAAQAQYNANNDELLLGFTHSGSTGDLVIDLGRFQSLTSGDLNTLGFTGYSTDAALKAAINGPNGLSLNSLSWGVVGGHAPNPNSAGIYTTVFHGTTFPTKNGSLIASAVGDNDTLGNSILSGKQAITDPSALNGNSVTEIWHNSAGSALLQIDWIDPTSQTSSTFLTGGTQFLTEDLYVQSLGGGKASLVGSFTLGSDGSLTYAAAAVPEPATYGVLSALGLLAVSIRRQFVRS